MKRFLFIFLLFALTACTAAPTPVSEQATHVPTEIAHTQTSTVIEPTAEIQAAATEEISDEAVKPTEPTKAIEATAVFLQQPDRDPEDWQNWPVVPEMTETAKTIYQQGLAQGRTGDAFIKIGDCETYSPWFLADFESDNYSLGEDNQNLAAVIDQFQGSYSRLSLAAKAGFNAASVLSPFWADREVCEAEETPLSCEIRIMEPSFALLTLGSNDVWQPEKFEGNYRAILDHLIEEGVVPILATKADNIEEDHAINLTIAKLAVEYDLPLWNFWAAVQDLPDQGLQEDGVHLTWAPNRFDDPLAMEKAWPVRNLTALQTLDVVWRGVTED